MNKELIRYTLTSPRRLIIYYAMILKVKWRDGIVYSVKVKTYLNRKKDYPENFEFEFPHIPSEIMDYIRNNKAMFQEMD